MCEDGRRAPVRSVSRWEIEKRKKTHPVHTGLEERPDCTRYVSVIALGVACAHAPFAVLASARLAVLIQRRARIQKCGGKGRLAV
jgi:hypothetical protein